MERLNFFSVTEQAVENFYASTVDPTARWPQVMLKGALCLAECAPSDTHRHVALAVNAVHTLTEIEQELFFAAHEMPSIVARNLDRAPAWPEMLEIQTYDEASPEDVEMFRAYAISQVNYLSGRARLSLITSLPGQDMLYIEKQNEAIRLLALETIPEDTSVVAPFLTAEIGLTAPTAFEVAQIYLNMAETFRVVGPQLEQVRIGSLIAIETASTTEEMMTTLDAFRAALAPTPPAAEESVEEEAPVEEPVIEEPVEEPVT